MTHQLEGQESLFGPDTWFGKMSMAAGPLPADTTKAKTSPQSSKKSSASQSRMPIFMCVSRTEDGQTQGATTLKMAPGVWRGGLWTLNTLERRSGEKGSVSFLTSTDSLRRRSCLTLNTSERPRMDNPSRLSQVLLPADRKYLLSPRACRGILNRAARRGKALPPELEAALEAQASALTTGNRR